MPVPVVTSIAGRARRAIRPPAAPPPVLIILSAAPYEGDVTWNALRLAGSLLERGATVRIFVMNDAIDLVRRGSAPEGAEFDLQAMLRGLLPKGARLKICTTCISRCGIGRGELLPEAIMATMADLAAWVVENDRVLVF
ncbi:MAG: DsrE family protein [Dehalococcoidia bacterium]|nr:MAG: sulfur reduction protein DsrE [bacterium]MCE7927819.1 sulfur reduction protein DsrE [Chloroflexi bacterium CFX7]MCK6563964.1 DsrE family protein [Dehalococcoidia bacterium]NUQ54942.1 DsrE family protein [Dehalococcoidia bacterium]